MVQVAVTNLKKARKPSVYAGLITCHKFFRPVTFGVTNLKKLENLVFMLVSAPVTDGTDLFPFYRRDLK